MAFSFRNEVINFLYNNANQAFSAREIAEYIANKFPENYKEKIKKSKNGYIKTKEDCIRQWIAEISAYNNNWEKKDVYYTSDRPRKYYISKNINDNSLSNKTKKINQPEKEL